MSEYVRIYASWFARGLLDRMPEDIPNINRIPERMPDRMPVYVGCKFAEQMPEHMLGHI